MAAVFLRYVTTACIFAHIAMIANYSNVDSFYIFMTVRTIVAAFIDTFHYNTIEVMKYPSVALEGIIVDMIFVFRTNTIETAGIVLFGGTCCHILSDYLHDGSIINPCQEIIRIYAYGFITIAHVIIMAAF